MTRRAAMGVLATLAGLVTGCSSPEPATIPDPIWTTSVDGVASFSGSYASDAGVVVTRFAADRTDDDGVTIAGDLDRVAAFDLDTGAHLWDADVPSGSEVLDPMVAAGGRLFRVEQTETGEAFEYETTLVAADLRTGEVLWEHAGLDDSAVGLAASGGLVVVSSASQDDFVDHVAVLDAATGADVVADLAHPSTDFARVFAGGDLVFVLAAGQLDAYDAAGGAAPVWRAEAADVGVDPVVVVRDDVVLVTGERTRTYAPADGAPLATIDARAEGGAFRRGADVVGFDLRSGAERWRIGPADLGGDVVAVTAESDGAVAVLTFGRLLLVDARTGEELGRVAPDEDALPGLDDAFLTAEAAYYVEVDRSEAFHTGRSALVAVDRRGERIFRTEGAAGLESSGLAGGLVIATNGHDLVGLP